MIPFPQWAPDLGPYSGGSIDVATNLLRSANGITPIPKLVRLSTQPLPSTPKGSWLVRNDAGTYTFFAATQTNLYKLASNGTWTLLMPLAPDTAINGTFATDTAWTKGTNVTISGGAAHFAAVTTGLGLTQSQTLTVGATYRITYTISNYVSGGFAAKLTGGTTVTGATRTANGTYTDDLVAVSGNNAVALLTQATSTLDIDNVSIQLVRTGFTGPGTNDYWQAEVFGDLLIFTNINDNPQKYNLDSGGTTVTDLGGSPPRAKYIETVGDFVFLSYLNTTHGSRHFQYSKINDAENWTIDGVPGNSDDQLLPDGEEIMGIFACPGGARIFQRKMKRRLTYSPASTYIFTVSDLDPMRGTVAPNAIVMLGGDSYININDTGIYRDDNHAPIGQDRVDKWFLDECDPTYLPAVYGVNDPLIRVAWLALRNSSGVYKLLGYDWGHDQWLYCDKQVVMLTTSISLGITMDSLSALMDSYAGVTMDSRLYAGGSITTGAFLTDNYLYLFAGAPMQTTIETATTELTPETGSFVTGCKIKGDVPAYTVAVGKSTLPDTALTWSSAASRSLRTGTVPFRSDGKFHRFRLTIPEDTSWSVCHGITPFYNPSGGA